MNFYLLLCLTIVVHVGHAQTNDSAVVDSKDIINDSGLELFGFGSTSASSGNSTSIVEDSIAASDDTSKDDTSSKDTTSKESKKKSKKDSKKDSQKDSKKDSTTNSETDSQLQNTASESISVNGAVSTMDNTRDGTIVSPPTGATSSSSKQNQVFGVSIATFVAILVGASVIIGLVAGIVIYALNNQYEDFDDYSPQAFQPYIPPARKAGITKSPFPATLPHGVTNVSMKLSPNKFKAQPQTPPAKLGRHTQGSFEL